MYAFTDPVTDATISFSIGIYENINVNGVWTPQYIRTVTATVPAGTTWADILAMPTSERPEALRSISSDYFGLWFDDCPDQNATAVTFYDEDVADYSSYIQTSDIRFRQEGFYESVVEANDKIIETTYYFCP